MATWSDVVAAAPSIAGGPAYANLGGCGQKTRPAPPRGHGNSSGTEWTETYDIAYGELVPALSAIFGTPQTVSIFGKPIVIYTPLIHPVFTGLVADSWESVDMGWDYDNNTMAVRRVAITFRKPPYPLSGVHPYVEVNTVPLAREEFSPAAGWQFPDNSNPLVDPNRTVGGSQILMTIYHLPGILDLSALDLYVRYCNKESWFGFPAECLLYDGSQVTTDQIQVSQYARNVRLNMRSTSPEWPWNHFSKADGTVDLLTDDGSATGARRYPTVVFDELFDFGVISV